MYVFACTVCSSSVRVDSLASIVSLKECTTIEGDVTIQGANDLLTLDSLTALESIAGSLQIRVRTESRQDCRTSKDHVVYSFSVLSTMPCCHLPLFSRIPSFLPLLVSILLFRLAVASLLPRTFNSNL